MVDDNAVQLQALKLLSTIKGRFDKQAQKNNIQKFYGKVFVVSNRPQRTEEESTIVSVSIDEEDKKSTPVGSTLIGPGWN